MKPLAPAARERAVLVGGPAHGLRLHVTDRPPVVQVTRPCELEEPTGSVPGLRAEALYVYRRDLSTHDEPLRYGFDGASP
ncbi:hypothetical protein ABII15_18480 [Streptomyces sp. HUAS MG91]|uniref:UbiC transcription regulator-associated domain-containing protein n=1 Tax=Streptomyces tabacisoli TaxID=3156398 RepID=A0AAU8IVJ8_9ACTN